MSRPSSTEPSYSAPPVAVCCWPRSLREHVRLCAPASISALSSPTFRSLDPLFSSVLPPLRPRSFRDLVPRPAMEAHTLF